MTKKFARRQQQKPKTIGTSGPAVEQIKKRYPDVYWAIWTRGRKAEKERRYWNGVKTILRGEKL